VATHDYVIANGTGAAVRSDLNGALAAIVSNNSSASEPAPTYAYMWWADTSAGLLKQRNSANAAWITIGTLASTNLGLATLASPTFTGTPAAPTASAGTNTTQIATTAFVLANTFPSGTAVLFQQTAAPTGWTKQTTNDNKALRVVSGTAGTGGTTGFTSVFTSRTPSGTVGNTTLTTAQMPSHTHALSGFITNNFVSGGPDYPYFFGTGGAGPNTAVTYPIASNGSDNSHTHSFTGTAIDFAVAYVDVIIATKN
jgi:hypothetical protein